MKRHPFDPISFVAGAVFLLIAVAAAAGSDFDLRLEVWLLPTAILILGIGLLAATLRSVKNPITDDDTAPDGERKSDF